MPDSKVKAIKKQETKILKEKIAAMSIVLNADKKRYAKLQTDLKDHYLMDNDQYPATIAGALKLLNNYSSEKPQTVR